ncbi:hypothetical protein LEWO105114_06470 [Legionella worsleiensis]|uniref:Uncharacterized protein n=1 Tax=Legionella worsleiensis TaxID=45076 RepID=A0A0W1AFU3_9GAMM|nr:hypothetical protein Lwor_1137 [Legionella worsleiensis]STY31687.1 Uncharacterised protein [Legionella worsleiensis]
MDPAHKAQDVGKRVAIYVHNLDAFALIVHVTPRNAVEKVILFKAIGLIAKFGDSRRKVQIYKKI